MRDRSLLGLRLALLGGVLVAAVGIAGHFAGSAGALGDTVRGPWLTATLGPTAYVLLAHPRTVTSRLRNALIGHSAGILSGLLALALFGLWSAPSTAETHEESVAQVGAQALALALTLLVLTLTDAHHAPSGATTLLVASGIAKPGPGLYGLLIGLALVLLLARPLARLPGHQGDQEDLGGR
jgi:hypothetical protein